MHPFLLTLIAVAVIVGFLALLGPSPDHPTFTTGTSIRDRVAGWVIALRTSDLGAVTLVEAAKNTVTPVDVQVIDEFRKESAILDELVFDDVVSANPGGGGVLTYGYRRLVTQGTAAYRAINAEYTPAEVTTEKVDVELAVLGGSFQVDRVTAKLGPAASGAVALQLSQKIKATKTFFQDQVINGDSAIDTNGFDGLDKALTGSDTEVDAEGADWTAVSSTNDSSHQALDLLDFFLSVLDGSPTMILGNTVALAKVRSVARRAGMHAVNPIDGLVGANGRPITRESYGNALFVDPGNKAGTNDPIIPIYDADNSTWSVTTADGADGGTFKLEVAVDGGPWEETAAIAFGASTATVDAAIEALDGVPAGSLTTGGIAGAWTLAFATGLALKQVRVRVSDQSVTDGGVPEDVVVAETGTKRGGHTDLYAIRFGLDGFHAVSTMGGQVVQTWLPRFDLPGAVKTGEVEMGPVAPVLKTTKAAAVLRGVKVR